jgi:8-oxo-dGTP pyrophosphatase MutT (NUDIX family)
MSILLLRRFNTGYEDGNYSVVAGHVEYGESVREAMRREALEEANIDLAIDDLHFAHIMFRRKTDSSVKADFFFRCSRWNGEIINMEPQKCDELRWCDLQSLPHNMVPYVRVALVRISEGQQFSEFGWQQDSATAPTPGPSAFGDRTCH